MEQNKPQEAAEQRLSFSGMPRYTEAVTSHGDNSVNIRYIFAGDVQGVGFRATIRHLASGLPVRGWVRNERDGSVTLEAEAPPNHLDQLLTAIRAAFGANISAISQSQPRPVQGLSGFEIRR